VGYDNTKGIGHRPMRTGCGGPRLRELTRRTDLTLGKKVPSNIFSSGANTQKQKSEQVSCLPLIIARKPSTIFPKVSHARKLLLF